MKVKRNIAVLRKLNKKDDSFVDLSAQERVYFIWELTKEVWSLKGDCNVKQRLQRNVAKLIKK